MNRAIAPEIKLIDTVHLPKYELIHLDNNVPVYIINEGEQEVVKIELMFKSGKWFEPKNLVADLTNRMLREGTTKHTAKQIADTFDFYGANINTGAGFETGGAVLYSLSREVTNILPLLFEVLTDSVFPEHEFETIITNRKQKLAVDMKKNDFIANRNFVNALYGQKHPYGRVTEPEHFSLISVQDLKDFFKKYYHAGNLTIIISGKFNDTLIKELNTTFGVKNWNGPKAEDNITYPVESSAELVHHVEKEESVQSAIAIGNLSINKTHPDFLKLSVLNTVFGGYFGSRLMSNIREEKGYTYGIYSSFVSYPHSGFLEIASEVGKPVREATMKEIEHEINVLRTEPVGEDELAVVKNYISGKILRSIDGPMKFSETLKGLIIYNQDTTYIQQFMKTVREVTAEELQALAVKYLDYSKMYKVTVG
jgi:predicted Zn-dependent peptidase